MNAMPVSPTPVDATSEADPFSAPRFFESYAYSSGEWSVVEFGGELDAACAAAMRSALDNALRPSPPKLIVDLSRTQFLDSSGFRVIARAGAEAEARGGMLRLVCPTGVLRDRLKVINAVSALPVLGDLYSALAAATDG